MLWHLIFITTFFAFGIESGKIRPIFDEIFGEEWDKNEREENIEKNGTESIDQMQNDQSIIKSDQNTKMEPNDQQKIKVILKFEAIKKSLKQKGKYEKKNQTKIESKIGKLLGESRQKIYKWKKELNLNTKKTNRMKESYYEQKKKEFVEQFDEFKELYGQGKQKEFIKDLGISERLFLKWKKELLPKYHKIHMRKKYLNDDKLEKMKQYFEIKEKNPKISDEIIAKKLGIGSATLIRWKKNFTAIQLSDL